MKESGYTVVSLTGGEPGLHKNFMEIISSISDLGLKYTFVTNGYDITPYLNAEKKFPGTCSALAVSLDGPTAKIHNKSRLKGFNEAKEAISTFSKSGLPVNVNMFVTEHNMNYISEEIKLVKSLGAASLWFASAIPNPGMVDSIPWDNCRKNVKIEALETSKACAIPVHFASCFLRTTDIMKCINMKDPQLNLNPEEEIAFCCNTQGRGAILGKYNEKSLLGYLEEAKKLGMEILDFKMKLYRKKDLNKFSSNCHLCDTYLYDKIKHFD